MTPAEIRAIAQEVAERRKKDWPQRPWQIDELTKIALEHADSMDGANSKSAEALSAPAVSLAPYIPFAPVRF